MKNKKFGRDLVYKFLSEAPGDEENEEGEAEEDEVDFDEEADESEDKDKEAVEVQPSILDSEINSVLIDFEALATPSEKVKEGFLYTEGISTLLEQNEENIDIEIFAGEVARLVKNYQNLIDMESLLVKKASKFITDKYGEETSQKMIDSLDSVHGISLEDKGEEESELSTPLAIGASAEGAEAS